MPRDLEVKAWKAKVTVELTPVNRYGDELGEGELTYTTKFDGSFVDVVRRLERLKEA